ncbi:MAG: hypothetical protein JSU85_15580 [Candidatus Zixiibacteriota bacterium]|nr:MAG: hypothetical protein JSU85_15580 [candidate division Zixibacteria bacterium]
MEFETIIWHGLAAFLTLCIFTFLYKDNPFYKFAERLVAGVAAGYWTMLVFHKLFVDKVYHTMATGQYAYIIPILLGIGMWTRFSKKHSWISRYSIAFYIGISTGVSIPVYMYTYIFRQISATIIPFTSISNVLVVIFVLCALFYFFFSKAHTGAFNIVSKIGIYTLMIGFGAGFGLTVMGRVALLVQRILFLKDYVREVAAFIGG